MIGFQAVCAHARPRTRLAISITIGLAMAIAAWNIDAAVRDWALELFPLGVRLAYYIPIVYAAAAAALVGLFCVDRWFLRPHMAFVGTMSKPLVLTTGGAVLATYLAAHGVAWLLGLPREPSMQTLFRFQTTPVQHIVVVASLLVLVPIAEELLYRHFVLSVFPWQNNAWWAFAGVLASAGLFTAIHDHYVYWTTYATLFLFAFIVGVARVASGGLALPVLLHLFAVVIALALNSLY